ncbi:hypothetical protein I5E97_16835 [Proteus hauseri]|nr:hypothetical protein [Proteus hauseri]MBG6032701.1 hypothetical protein [Proteus hauseri]
MIRSKMVVKYIEDRVKKISRNAIDIKNLVNNDLVKTTGKIINESDENRYIDYLLMFQRNLGTISLLYIMQVYRKEKKIPYLFEESLYFSNVIIILDFLSYNYRNENFISFSQQGEILLMNFACNYFKSSQICYDKIIENIQSGKMANSLPMYTRPQKLGVLAIEMLASEKKETIDWESAGIPIDPFYQRFCQEALYCENDEILIPWLMELCDKHIQWSALFRNNENEQSATGYEVDMEILIAWPFEYQAVKNFRARHGLSTPIIDHPLLKTPMAIDHRPDMVGWLETMPEIYHHITDDLIKINPELKVIHTLF